MEQLFSWGKNIQKRIITFIIKKLIGQYLEYPLQKEQVEYYFSEGYVKLTNIEIKKSILQDSNDKIPLRIESSLVSEIILKFSWSNFWKNDIHLEIPEINFNLKFLNDDEIDNMLPRSKFFDLKESILNNKAYLLETPNEKQPIETEPGIELLSDVIKDIINRVKFSVDKIKITIQYEHCLELLFENIILNFNNLEINQVSVNLDKEKFISLESIFFDYSETNPSSSTSSKSHLKAKIKTAKGTLSLPILLYLNDFNLVLLHTSNLLEEHHSSYLMRGVSSKSFFDDNKFIQKIRQNYYNTTVDDLVQSISHYQEEEENQDKISIGSFKLYDSLIEVGIDNLNLMVVNQSNQLLLNSKKLTLEITDGNQLTIKIPRISLSEDSLKILEINKIGFHLEPREKPRYYLSLGLGRIIVLYDILFLNRWYNFIQALNSDYHTQQNLDIFWESASSFLLMMKIQELYLKIKIPIQSSGATESTENPIVYYPYTLFGKANNLQGVVNVSKFKIRLPYLNLYLSDDNFQINEFTDETNWGQKFFETEMVDVIFANNNQRKPSGFSSQRQFFSSKTLCGHKLGEFYYCPSDSEYRQFRKTLDRDTSGTLKINFSQETHLIFTEFLPQVGQLINGFSNYQSPLPPSDSYFVLDLSLNLIYVIFQDKYAGKAIDIKYYGAFNVINKTQYLYLTIGDLLIWNQTDNSLILRKMDSRVKHILTMAFHTHTNIETQIKYAIKSIDIKKVLFEYDHYAEKEKPFWLFDIIEMLSIDNVCHCLLDDESTNNQNHQGDNICKCSEKKGEYIVSKIFLSSQESYLNYYLKGEQFQFKANQLDYMFRKRYLEDSSLEKPAQHIVQCSSLKGYLNKMSNKIQIFSSKFIEWNLIEKYPLIKLERLILHLTKDVIYQFKKLIGENHQQKEYMDCYISDVDTSLVSRLMEQALRSSGGKSIISKMGKLIRSPLQSVVVGKNSKNGKNSKKNLESYLTKELKEFQIANLEVNFYQGLDFLNSRNLNQLLKVELMNLNLNILTIDNPECLDRKITEYLLRVDNYLISGDVSPNLKPYPNLKSYFGKIKPSKINHLMWKPKVKTDKGLEIKFKLRDGMVSIDNDISVHLFPSKIYLTQHLINFILDYYRYFQNEDEMDFQIIDIEEPKDPNYFEQCNFDQFYLQISYSSKIFDLNLPNQMLLLNFLQVDKLDMIFKPYCLNGISGYQRFFETIAEHYLNVILNEKKFKIIKSLRPLKTLVKIGSNMINMILVPNGKDNSNSGCNNRLENEEIISEIKKVLRNAKPLQYEDDSLEIIENLQEFDEVLDNQENKNDIKIAIPSSQWNTKGITKTIFDTLESNI